MENNFKGIIYTKTNKTVMSSKKKKKILGRLNANAFVFRYQKLNPDLGCAV